MTLAAQPKLSTLARTPKSSAISDLLALAGRPEVISFAGGLPSPAGFPVDAVNDACQWVMRNQATRALQYSQGEGVPELREVLAERETSLGNPTTPDQVQIVTGSQQALDLIGRLFLDKGTKMLVESPTYLGALSAFNQYFPKYAEIPVDEQGMNPDKFGADCDSATVAYVMPTFANPTGLTIDAGRRQKLADIARAKDFWLVEDNPYGELWYDKKPALPVRTFAPERTIYLGTLSKILSPGLRLGYIIADAEIIKAFTSFKQAVDLHTSTFTQLVAARVISSGVLVDHLPKVRDLYKVQCNAMLEALDEYMPKDVGINWTRPTGGMFIWLTLPKSIDSSELMRRTIQKNVAFVPSVAFYANEAQVSHARLSFVTVPVEKIREGIKIMAETIKTML